MVETEFAAVSIVSLVFRSGVSMVSSVPVVSFRCFGF